MLNFGTKELFGFIAHRWLVRFSPWFFYDIKW